MKMPNCRRCFKVRKCDISMTNTLPSDDLEPKPLWYIVDTSGVLEPDMKIFSTRKDVITLGRSRKNDICLLRYNAVSKKHLTLVRKNDTLLVYSILGAQWQCVGKEEPKTGIPIETTLGMKWKTITAGKPEGNEIQNKELKEIFNGYISRSEAGFLPDFLVLTQEDFIRLKIDEIEQNSYIQIDNLYFQKCDDSVLKEAASYFLKNNLAVSSLNQDDIIISIMNLGVKQQKQKMIDKLRNEFGICQTLISKDSFFQVDGYFFQPSANQVLYSKSTFGVQGTEEIKIEFTFYNAKDYKATVLVKCPFTPDGDTCNECENKADGTHICDKEEHEIKNGIDKVVITKFLSIPKILCKTMFAASLEAALHGRSLCMVFTDGKNKIVERDNEIRNTLIKMGVGCKVLNRENIGSNSCYWDATLNKIKANIDETGNYSKKQLFDRIVSSPTKIVSIEEYGGTPLTSLGVKVPLDRIQFGRFLDGIRDFLWIFSQGWKSTCRVHGDLHSGNLLTLFEEGEFKKINVIDVDWLSSFINKSPLLKDYNEFEIFLFALTKCASNDLFIRMQDKLPPEVNLFVAFCIDDSTDKQNTKTEFLDYYVRKLNLTKYIGMKLFERCLGFFGIDDNQVYTSGGNDTSERLIKRARRYHDGIVNSMTHKTNLMCFIDTYAISRTFFKTLQRLQAVYEHGENTNRLNMYVSAFDYALCQPIIPHTCDIDTDCRRVLYSQSCNWHMITDEIDTAVFKELDSESGAVFSDMWESDEIKFPENCLKLLDSENRTIVFRVFRTPDGYDHLEFSHYELGILEHTYSLKEIIFSISDNVGCTHFKLSCIVGNKENDRYSFYFSMFRFLQKFNNWYTTNQDLIISVGRGDGVRVYSPNMDPRFD